MRIHVNKGYGTRKGCNGMNDHDFFFGKKKMFSAGVGGGLLRFWGCVYTQCISRAKFLFCLLCALDA